MRSQVSIQKTIYSQCVYEKKSFIGWLYNCSVDAVLNEHYGLSQPNMFYVFLALLCKNFLTGVPLSPPKANGKFLDVGCGAGYWGGKLKKLGWITRGIDLIGEESDDIFIADFCGYEFKEKFEFIRASGVLEHAKDVEKFVKKISLLLLNNESICQISVPQTNSFGLKYFKENWIDFEVPRHLHSFNLNNLAILLERSSLEVVGIGHELALGAFVHQLSLKWKLKFILKAWPLFYFLFIPIDFLLKKVKKSVNVTLTIKRTQSSPSSLGK